MRTTSSPSRKRSGGPAQVRRQPQRTCVGCRRTGDQPTFVRLVRRGDGGVAVDEGRRREPGRGAYLCRNAACWERALHGSLERALRTGIDEANRRELEAYAGQFESTTTTGITRTAEGGSDAPVAPHTGGAGQKEREV